MTAPLDPGSETLDSVLARLARPSPDVGGGAAAALVGAIAAALLAMVAGLTARRSPESGAGAFESEAQELRCRLIALAGGDIDAYRGVVEARRLPLAERATALSRALVGATGVPLGTARCSARVLEACAAVVAQAPPGALGDLGVAAALAGAALESAALTARINLREVDAPAFVEASEAELARLLRDGAAWRQRVLRATES